MDDTYSHSFPSLSPSLQCPRCYTSQGTPILSPSSTLSDHDSNFPLTPPSHGCYKVEDLPFQKEKEKEISKQYIELLEASQKAIGAERDPASQSNFKSMREGEDRQQLLHNGEDASPIDTEEILKERDVARRTVEGLRTIVEEQERELRAQKEELLMITKHWQEERQKWAQEKLDLQSKANVSTTQLQTAVNEIAVSSGISEAHVALQSQTRSCLEINGTEDARPLAPRPSTYVMNGSNMDSLSVVQELGYDGKERELDNHSQLPEEQTPQRTATAILTSKEREDTPKRLSVSSSMTLYFSPQSTPEKSPNGTSRSARHVHEETGVDFKHISSSTAEEEFVAIRSSLRDKVEPASVYRSTIATLDFRASSPKDVVDQWSLETESSLSSSQNCTATAPGILALASAAPPTNPIPAFQETKPFRPSPLLSHPVSATSFEFSKPANNSASAMQDEARNTSGGLQSPQRISASLRELGVCSSIISSNSHFVISPATHATIGHKVSYSNRSSRYMSSMTSTARTSTERARPETTTRSSSFTKRSKRQSLLGGLSALDPRSWRPSSIGPTLAVPARRSSRGRPLSISNKDTILARNSASLSSSREVDDGLNRSKLRKAYSVALLNPDLQKKSSVSRLRQAFQKSTASADRKTLRYENNGAASCTPHLTACSRRLSQIESRPDAAATLSDMNSVLNAVTAATVGQWMWKYTRKTKGFSLSDSLAQDPHRSEVRHRRWVWVNPQYKMIMWSNKQPSSKAGLLGTGGRRLEITSVLDVRDDTPIPGSRDGMNDTVDFNRSILILTPTRALKFTATSLERHYLWLTALSFVAHHSSSSLKHNIDIPSQEIVTGNASSGEHAAQRMFHDNQAASNHRPTFDSTVSDSALLSTSYPLTSANMEDLLADIALPPHIPRLRPREQASHSSSTSTSTTKSPTPPPSSYSSSITNPSSPASRLSRHVSYSNINSTRSTSNFLAPPRRNTLTHAILSPTSLCSSKINEIDEDGSSYRGSFCDGYADSPQVFSAKALKYSSVPVSSLNFDGTAGRAVRPGEEQGGEHGSGRNVTFFDQPLAPEFPSASALDAGNPDTIPFATSEYVFTSKDTNGILHDEIYLSADESMRSYEQDESDDDAAPPPIARSRVVEYKTSPQQMEPWRVMI